MSSSVVWFDAKISSSLLKNLSNLGVDVRGGIILENYSRSNVMSVLNEVQLKAIKNIIRWHYYQCQRGCYSADPSYVGIDFEILEQLESCCDKHDIIKLKSEGMKWAKNWLESPEMLIGKEIEWKL